MNPNLVYMVHEEKAYNREFVLNFLEEHYFTREPLLTKYMKLQALIITTALRETILSDLRRRYDLIVRDCILVLVGVHVETGLRCGIGLALLERRKDQGMVPEWERMQFTSELLAVWCRYVLLVAERRTNLFDLFPDVNTIMKIVMIGVHQDHERKLIGTNMLREMCDRANRYGAELVYGLFTSEYLKRVAIRFGFRSYCDMNLSDFRDPEGYMMYEGAAPGVVSLMVIRVN